MTSATQFHCPKLYSTFSQTKQKEHFKREAQWPIGYGVGLRIKRSSVRIRPWPLRWVLGQGSLLPLSQGEEFTLASISYLAILVKYILAKKKQQAIFFCFLHSSYKTQCCATCLFFTMQNKLKMEHCWSTTRLKSCVLNQAGCSSSNGIYGHVRQLKWY